MLLVDDKENSLQIYMDNEPNITIKSSRLYSKEEMKKPFLNKTRIAFTIFYKNEQYVILIPKGYDWDGATIPRLFWFLIGSKTSPEFLIPSMVHDKLTENKLIANCDRLLTSLIFKDLLLAYNVPKWKANIMAFCVNQFQRFMRGWK